MSVTTPSTTNPLSNPFPDAIARHARGDSRGAASSWAAARARWAGVWRVARWALLTLAVLAVVAGSVVVYIRYARQRVNLDTWRPDISFYRAAAAAPLAPPPADSAETPARNVILLIGDGMGPGLVHLASLQAAGRGGRLHMERMPVAGVSRTRSASGPVTDSAAGATALATGHKTHNGHLALLPDGRPLPTLLERFAQRGGATGVVVSGCLVDATPAAFFCHLPDRNRGHDIAACVAESPPDVLMGGDPKFWRAADRADGRDLVEELRQRGYGIAQTADELDALSGDRLFVLFPWRKRRTNPAAPTLPQMTAKALSTLAASDKARAGGMFLMVEGTAIDHYAHKNNFDGALKETLWFDLAVGEALRFAARTPGTLVVVTADHDTGGVAFPGRKGVYRAQWTTTGHTSLSVPVFAYGAGAERFTGQLENTDIARRIAELAGVELAPETVPAESVASARPVVSAPRAAG